MWFKHAFWWCFKFYSVKLHMNNGGHSGKAYSTDAIVHASGSFFRWGKYYLIFRPGSIYLKRLRMKVFLKTYNYALANMIFISGCLITALTGIVAKFTVC